MSAIPGPAVLLALLLVLTGCEDEETGSATDTGTGAGADSAAGGVIDDGSADDVTIGDGSADEQDGTADATPDADSCLGEPRSCTELATSRHCGDVAINEVCVAGSYRCPDGFVLECPSNPQECPLDGDFSMDGTSCEVPEEEICSYRGDSGTAPCPGNLFDCRCESDTWSCTCAM